MNTVNRIEDDETTKFIRPPLVRQNARTDFDGPPPLVRQYGTRKLPVNRIEDGTLGGRKRKSYKQRKSKKSRKTKK